MVYKREQESGRRTGSKAPSSRSSPEKLTPPSCEEQVTADHATQREADDPKNESDVVMNESANALDDWKYSEEYHAKEHAALGELKIHQPESQCPLRSAVQFVFGNSDKTETVSKPQRQIEGWRREHSIMKKQLQETTAHLHQLSKMEEGQRAKLYEQDQLIFHLENESAKLQRSLNQTKEELKTANENIVEKEVLINRAHTTLVSRLASDVSCEFPDDMVRRELQAFFQGDFLSWCADLSVTSIRQPDEAEKFLRKAGLINNSKDDAPRELKLDIYQHDGVASLALLQAALSHTLCDLYLKDPFFLAARNREATLAGTSEKQTTHGLGDFNMEFAQAQLDSAIDWRIKTVELLEVTRPLTRESARCSAMKFAGNYGFLFNQDNEAMDDLVGLFERFATIALKLWKRKSTIRVFSKPGQFAKIGFQWKSDKMESAADSHPSLGRLLQGHPIGLLIRPLIIAETMTGQRERGRVVWTKAVAWVSMGQ